MTTTDRITHTIIPGCQEDAALPTPDPESTACYLALSIEDCDRLIAHLSAACRDARVDESLGEFTLDALRGIRAEIAAELEARHAV